MLRRRWLLTAQYDIKEMTPEIQQALDARKARFSQLRALKNQGLIGENNQGLVEALGGDASAQALVQAENADRTLIYEAIVEQHQLGAAGLEQVKAAFAEVQRDKAQAGDSIQLPSGAWSSK
jgi:uncharacterized protein YdbL (DUF1318 family)